MADGSTDQHSAGEQGLGYIYQPRFALLQLLQLPETTSILIEKDDDIDFVSEEGSKTLGSLKHKRVGDRLTDLSVDFWKSVRIWLARYERDERSASDLRFFLFTTSAVSQTSFLRYFLPSANGYLDISLVKLAEEALDETKSQVIRAVAEAFHQLEETEKSDFLSRITIFDAAPRIDDIPSIIKAQHMRGVYRAYRDQVFQRLEGWWNDEVVKLLTGKRTEPIFGYEVSDKLWNFAEEYKADNLPITFRGKRPPEADSKNDKRLFVVQLRMIGIGSNRIRNAILDYYRAFQQRSEWARESLLIAGEMEDYEDRLVDEWERYRDVVFENLTEGAGEELLAQVGRALYQWADLESGNIKALRIRERVTEPYVVRGSFHLLANMRPMPPVYWHPRFLSRMRNLLSEAGQ
jgi:hypothetical protein